MLPFPDLSSAVPEVTEIVARLPHLPVSGPVAAPPEAHDPAEKKQCEGGDLNPYASYGASTSS
jgi:hypothetical protein